MVTLSVDPAFICWSLLQRLFPSRLCPEGEGGSAPCLRGNTALRPWRLLEPGPRDKPFLFSAVTARFTATATATATASVPASASVLHLIDANHQLSEHLLLDVLLHEPSRGEGLLCPLQLLVHDMLPYEWQGALSASAPSFMISMV